MSSISFSFKDSLISKEEIDSESKRMDAEIKSMNRASSSGYEDDRSSINLPEDKKLLSSVRGAISKKMKLKPKCIVVVGIGGSNLGTVAVQEAVLGKLHNQMNPKIKIIYADTVDTCLISDIKKIISSMLKNGENVIINGVSKSGATTETIANFEVLVGVLKKYRNDYEEQVVVTTDRNSKYWSLALKNGFDVLEIPKKVGGRYSVFSPVGLFPLGMVGVNIKKLLSGAASMKKKCLVSPKYNPAAVSAIIHFLHYKKGVNISDLFLFGNDFESIGKWNRQLMGESIGKEYNLRNERVNCGMTPTVSIGSTDLHSMAQLYLGGPYDKLTTFVKVSKASPSVKVPDFKEYSELVESINGKKLSSIMDAIMEGVKYSYRKGKRPFTEIILPDKSENSVGQFLQFKMMEMMCLGSLLGVNPFDQPNVEDYKKETKNILNRR